MGNHTKVLLVQTRWHESDLGGRLLETEGDKAKGGKWRVISIPARCEDERTDLLGRREGEYMTSARGRTVKDWEERRKDVGEYVWCTPAETPIMMADWTTKPISEIQPGDKVMGYRKGNKAARLELAPTVVEGVATRHAPVQTMRMESGATVRCTAEHQWYTGRNPDRPDIDRRYPKHVARPRQMYAPAKVGTRLFRFDPVIPDLTQRRQRLLDYLAGMLDGEGTWQAAALTIAQSPDANPETFAKINEVITELGYRFTASVTEHAGHPEWGRKGCFVIWDMRAVAAEMLRRTEMAKRDKAVAHLLARPHKPTRFKDRVEEIIPGDAETVYALQTGTGNYVAWGYASSNSALFQQRPAPAEGGVFKRLWWRYWTPAGPDRIYLGGRIADLRDGWRFGTVDLAASTRTSADYTVIAAWCRTLAGDLVLLDMVRAKLGEEQHFAQARPLIERWNLDTLFVEASQYGFTLVKEATQHGVPVTPIQAEQDKLTRALPYSAWCSGGRAWLPAGVHWLQTWIDEHAGFPSAAHDDTVDVGSLATRVSITQWVPLVNRVQQATSRPEPDPFGGQPEVDWETRAF